jgi:D-alanyl-D-alanine carboxypeptidase
LRASTTLTPVARLVRLLPAFSACVVACILTSGAPGLADARSPAPATAPSQATPDEAQAWILVDADTRVVLDGKDVHKPLPPAAAGKLMNAFTALQRLAIEPIDARKANQVLVSQQAANAPRPRLGIGSGGAWAVAPLLNAMLMISANDAAYALAETASGSLETFTAEMNTQAKRMGMRDSTWSDALGDDDSAAKPNTASAWDLAVLARAVLADPQLSDTSRAHGRVVNGPGLGRTITNNNDFLDRYAGATGIKQGVSINAGGGVLVASATRENRTLIAVVLGSPNPIPFASSKLDQGFFTKPGVTGRRKVDRLPELRSSTVQGRLEALVNLPALLGRSTLQPGVSGAEAKPTPAPPPTTAPRRKPASDGGGDGLFTLTNVLILLLLVGLAVVIFLRRRAVTEQRTRRVVSRRTIAEARRRGTIDVIEPEQMVGSSHVRVLDPDESRGPGSRAR